MIDYDIALGATIPQLREDVNRLLNADYRLAGNLVALLSRDEEGEYVTFYQADDQFKR